MNLNQLEDWIHTLVWEVPRIKLDEFPVIDTKRDRQLWDQTGHIIQVHILNRIYEVTDGQH